jgi:hypothetical protein
VVGWWGAIGLEPITSSGGWRLSEPEVRDRTLRPIGQSVSQEAGHTLDLARFLSLWKPLVVPGDDQLSVSEPENRCSNRTLFCAVATLLDSDNYLRTRLPWHFSNSVQHIVGGAPHCNFSGLIRVWCGARIDKFWSRCGGASLSNGLANGGNCISPAGGIRFLPYFFGGVRQNFANGVVFGRSHSPL